MAVHVCTVIIQVYYTRDTHTSVICDKCTNGEHRMQSLTPSNFVKLSCRNMCICMTTTFCIGVHCCGEISNMMTHTNMYILNEAC